MLIIYITKQKPGILARDFAFGEPLSYLLWCFGRSWYQKLLSLFFSHQHLATGLHGCVPWYKSGAGEWMHATAAREAAAQKTGKAITSSWATILSKQTEGLSSVDKPRWAPHVWHVGPWAGASLGNCPAVLWALLSQGQPQGFGHWAAVVGIWRFNPQRERSRALGLSLWYFS